MKTYHPDENDHITLAIEESDDLISERSEREFFGDPDLLWKTNQRYLLLLFLQLAVIVSLTAALIVIARSKAGQAPIIVGIDQQGSHYILNAGTQKLNVSDFLIMKAIQRDVAQWAQAMYTRDPDPAIYKRDWWVARQFMSNRMIKDEDLKYASTGGRQATYLKLPPCSIQVGPVISTDADRVASPYTARVRIIKTIDNSQTEAWDLLITFIVDPSLAAKTRSPRYNDIGFFIEKVSETQEEQ
jgi:hypothetical protein